jgi:hypothetical protein
MNAPVVTIEDATIAEAELEFPSDFKPTHRTCHSYFRLYQYQLLTEITPLHQ